MFPSLSGGIWILLPIGTHNGLYLTLFGCQSGLVGAFNERTLKNSSTQSPPSTRPKPTSGPAQDYSWLKKRSVSRSPTHPLYIYIAQRTLRFLSYKSDSCLKAPAFSLQVRFWKTSFRCLLYVSFFLSFFWWFIFLRFGGFMLFDYVCLWGKAVDIFFFFEFLLMGCLEEKKQDIIAVCFVGYVNRWEGKQGKQVDLLAIVFVGYTNCLERMCLCLCLEVWSFVLSWIEFVCCRSWVVWILSSVWIFLVKTKESKEI